MQLLTYLKWGSLPMITYWSLLVPSTVATVSWLPSYPLAVKNPYLSAWAEGRELINAPSATAQFWNAQQLNWVIYARVNGTTYSLFGDAKGLHSPATAQAVEYTSSHTLVHEAIGSLNISLDFFSPVLPGPDDYARQSLPYSYFTVSVVETGSSTSNVQIISGIDSTWNAQGDEAALNFSTTGTAGYYQFHNPQAVPYSEDNDMATYGSVIFATTYNESTSLGCGTLSALPVEFDKAESSNVTNVCSNASREAMAYFSKDLSNVRGAPVGVTFAIGFERGDQAIQYLNTSQTGYHRTRWPSIASAVDYFLNDYETALNESRLLDAAVKAQAQSVSSNFGDQYAQILEASVRQTFGAIDITIPSANLTAEPSVFLKEISSDGNVNTVDLIHQSWPIFISLNPNYIKMLFLPILDYLQQGLWPHPWVIHDLGTHYPNATGHNDGNAESMPLYETSSLFILLQAYQCYTGDRAFAAGYTTLLDGYAQYLLQTSLYPADELVSVDRISPTANQTALAVQSAIGLNAAGLILNNETYSQTGRSFASVIYDEGLGLDASTPSNSTHFTYNYGKDATWNVLYSAFDDVILGLATFPPDAWEMQSAWYLQQMQAGGLPYAGPVTDLNYTGSAITWGITDWNIMAASVSSPTVQQQVIDTTWKFLFNGLNNVPFGTLYAVETLSGAGPPVGTWLSNRARSTVGTHFSLLALLRGWWWDAPSPSLGVPPPSSAETNTGAASSTFRVCPALASPSTS